MSLETTPAVLPAADDSRHLSRRGVLKGLLAGGALAVAPIRAFDAVAAAAPAANGVFGYGVASGDPTPDQVIIWTRATPPGIGGNPAPAPGTDGGPGLPVTWQVASDNAFAHIVASGTVATSAATDYTVKVDVTGLAAYTRYYYRFTAGGETSRTGRTQTSPAANDVRALRFALVSCSNYTGGYFSAYRVIGGRDDLDFVMHVGDYIYEYGNVPSGQTTPAGNKGDRYGPSKLVGVRDGDPGDDLILLQDYRLRHALHKADPDNALAHQQTPWISIFDDHEVANNTWNTGAENQHPTTPAGRPEPAFADRRASAYQAYLEWMPFRYPVLPSQQVDHDGQQFFRRYTYGALADLSVLETRQNRSQQIDMPGSTSTGGGFIDPATPGLSDASRHMPEPKQTSWLTSGLNAAGHTWHLVGNQVMFTPIRYPAALVNPGLKSVVAINSDQWDGYPVNQLGLIAAIGNAPKASGDTVFFTGDIHSSWACDLPVNEATYATDGGQSAGVEFVCPSVTSDGFYEVVGGSGAPAAAAVTVVNGTVIPAIKALTPWVKYLDGIGHGFTVIDVTPARIQCDYYLTPVPTLAQPDPRAVQSVVPAFATSYQTLAGSRKVSAATGPVGPRSDIPADASAAATAALPDGVGPVAVVGALAAGALVALSRRRRALAIDGQPTPDLEIS